MAEEKIKTGLEKGFVFKTQFNYINDKNPGITLSDEKDILEYDKEKDLLVSKGKEKVSDLIQSVKRPSFKDSITKKEDGTMIVNTNIKEGIYADVTHSPLSIIELKQYADRLSRRINDLEKLKQEQELVARVKEKEKVVEDKTK